MSILFFFSLFYLQPSALVVVAVLCPGNRRLRLRWRQPVVSAQHSCMTSSSLMSFTTIQATTLWFLLPFLSLSSLSIFPLSLNSFEDLPHFYTLPDIKLSPERSLALDSFTPSFRQIAHDLPQSCIELAPGCLGRWSMINERRILNITPLTPQINYTANQDCRDFHSISQSVSW